ncbi:MAG: hypothetical protein A3B70_04175 [Deltaproteobacteria bacterium RIFCSPHIGHO2_02_FULL_40_11]|nr:MAG: hypothetical protein A3B70_04175 [Deltaproteobacteria bacterium RIFCSPHIGHO2_02_FULL_40_11]
MKRLLLVGARKEAVKAAQKATYPFLIWNETFIPKRNSISAIIATKENSVIPAAKLRKKLNLPGIYPRTALLCRDKFLMKRLLQKQKIHVTPFSILSKKTPALWLEKTFGFPMVLKKRDSSGSRGQKIIRDRSRLQKSIQAGFLAEKWIQGKEYSVESFIQNKKILFRNITEYYLPTHINIMPAALSKTVRKKIDLLNAKVIRALKIHQGITHLECFMTQKGLVFGEIAIRPPGGYLMHLLKMTYGFDPWKALFDIELGKKVTFPKKNKKTTGSWVIHPGSGMVSRVRGLKTIKSLPQVRKISLRLKEGDTLKKRGSVGESYGKILLSTQTRKELLETISKIQNLLKITVS